MGSTPVECTNFKPRGDAGTYELHLWIEAFSDAIVHGEPPHGPHIHPLGGRPKFGVRIPKMGMCASFSTDASFSGGVPFGHGLRGRSRNQSSGAETTHGTSIIRLP